MRFAIITLAIFLNSFSFYGQAEHCESSENSIIDINSITKCSIEDVQKSLESTSEEKKVIKYRKKRTKISSNSVATISSVATTVSEKSLHTIISKENNKLTNVIKSGRSALVLAQKIPFHLVEQIPLFKDCELVPILEQTKCFEKKMAKHITRNFKYPVAALKNKIEGRILVQFTINEKGEVTDIKRKGPEGTDLLKSEVVALIKKLPQFVPGSHKGNLVKVKYALPISFKLPAAYR